jgi:hypothetical protein
LPAIDWSEYEFVGPELSDEELERRCKSDEKCFTTDEVLEYLRKLGVPRPVEIRRGFSQSVGADYNATEWK